MASLNRFSSAFPRQMSDRGRMARWLLGGCLAALSAQAEMPGYLHKALTSFTLGLPPGWACTITTTRNNETLVEQYHPARGRNHPWTLVECHGRAPSASEQDKYVRSRPIGSSVGPQANFQKSDIEPGSLMLVSENDAVAVFKGAFRLESTGADKMLGHLVLHLTVNKPQSYVAGYTLSLADPYSPVLGVKMDELQVEARFGAPRANQPSLPLSYNSRFRGRFFFFSTRENLAVTYTNLIRIE